MVIAFTWLIAFFHKYRSSLSDVFLEKDVLKICNNYRGPMPKCDFDKVRTASVNRICEYKIHCWYSNPKNCYKTFWLNLFLSNVYEAVLLLLYLLINTAYNCLRLPYFHTFQTGIWPVLFSFLNSKLRLIQEIFSFCFDIIVWSSHRRYFVKKTVLKISQNPQENTFAWASFLIKPRRRPAILLKKILRHRCFTVNFANFWKKHFYRIPLGDCICIAIKHCVNHSR